MGFSPVRNLLELTSQWDSNSIPICGTLCKKVFLRARKSIAYHVLLYSHLNEMIK